MKELFYKNHHLILPYISLMSIFKYYCCISLTITIINEYIRSSSDWLRACRSASRSFPSSFNRSSRTSTKSSSIWPESGLKLRSPGLKKHMLIRSTIVRIRTRRDHFWISLVLAEIQLQKILELRFEEMEWNAGPVGSRANRILILVSSLNTQNMETAARDGYTISRSTLRSPSAPPPPSPGAPKHRYCSYSSWPLCLSGGRLPSSWWCWIPSLLVPAAENKRASLCKAIYRSSLIILSLLALLASSRFIKSLFCTSISSNL